MKFSAEFLPSRVRYALGDFLRGALLQVVIGCSVGALACTSAEADEFVTPHKPDLPHRELVFPLEAIVKRVSGGQNRIIEAYRYLEHGDPHLGDIVLLRHEGDQWTIYWRWGSGRRVLSGHCRLDELDASHRKEVEDLLALLRTDAAWTSPRPVDGTEVIGGIVQMAAHFSDEKLKVSRVNSPAEGAEPANLPLQKASLVASNLWKNLAK